MDDCLVMALCRHGLTEANKKRAYLGWTDSPLIQVPAPMMSKNFDGYFSSDLDRCISTFKGLFPEIEPLKLRDLREMNFGDFEGLSFEELKVNDHYIKWIQNYEGVSPPNGENFQQFISRIMLGWNKIIQEVSEKQWKRSIVVTHAGVIRHFLTLYAPEEKGYWDWEVSHDVLYELVFTKQGLKTGDRALSLKKVPIKRGTTDENLYQNR